MTYDGRINTNGGWLFDTEKLMQEQNITKEEKKAMERYAEKIKTAKFDNTFVFMGQESGEMKDRKTMDWNQKVFADLKDLTQSPGKIIGVMVTPGPILTNKIKEDAQAMILNIMPGQQYTNGLMNVLFGRADPAGRLAFTMPNKDNEQNMTQHQFPGDDNGKNSYYTEKAIFGYRWYDQNKVTPAFEFGFGLSYATFNYSLVGETLNAEGTSPGPVAAYKLHITNVGKVTGSEVVQLYIGQPDNEAFPAGHRAPLVLKNFQKVKDLKPGEAREVTLTVDLADLTYWNEDQQNWSIVDNSKYSVHIGSSSRNIMHNAEICYKCK